MTICGIAILRTGGDSTHSNASFSYTSLFGGINGQIDCLIAREVLMGCFDICQAAKTQGHSTDDTAVDRKYREFPVLGNVLPIMVGQRP